MTTKRGRMLIVKCDNCKSEVSRASKLILSIEPGGKDNVVWDICRECVPKVEETFLAVLGPGRKIRN